MRLLLIAVVVMAAVLALVFRRRLRLVPLVVALAAVTLTFGAMALVGAPLTMASIAVLPVLLGLAVDYAIQYQSRIPDPPGPASAALAARRAVPVIATAALATAAGFLVLLLSPVPMVRGFGALLVLGVGVAFAVALTGGTALLVALGRRRRRGPLARSARGAGELLGAASRPLGRVARPAGRVGRATLRTALRRPGRVLALGLALAALGWIADTQTEVRSDLQQLVPQDLAAVRDLDTLQAATGVAGEVDVLVEGKDLTDPAVIAWMADYQRRVLKEARYSEANGCGRAALCPALSLPDLFQGGAAADRERVTALLDAVPPYFSQAVLTADRRTANLAFGIRLAPLDEQGRVIERMRAQLDPPAGVTARIAGLPVLAAEANAALASPWRRLGTLLAGPRGGRPRAAARVPARRARLGAARPDRARHGLVGARPVPPADPAQPDVGDARRAGDRTLDRVRRPARRALPGGARGRARPGGGAAGDVLRRRAPRCSRPGRRRSRASRCWPSPTSACSRSWGS